MFTTNSVSPTLIIDEHLPVKLIGDDLKFQQILFNLLTNAVKYTNEGYVRLCVSQKKRQADSVAIEVSVEDSGIGIRKEDIEKVKDITILAESEKAGVFLAIANEGRKIFVMGHPEYDLVTLD